LLNGQTTEKASIASRLSAIRDQIDGRIRERKWLDTLGV
jgi:hypothetical protein